MNFGELLQSKKKSHFYLMHLSYGYDLKERERLWNYAVRENLIGLDLPDKVQTDWNNLTETEKKAVGRFWVRQFNLFCNEMIIGDYVVVANGHLYLLGIAKVTEQKYYFDRKLSGTEKTGFFDHIRKVKWIMVHDYEGLPFSQQLKGFNGTILKVTPESRYWDTLTGLDL